MNSSLPHQGQRLLQTGIVFILYASFEGFAIPFVASSRVGLSAHTLGALEGVLLLALGLLWPRLSLRAIVSRVAFWCLLYSAFAILGAYTIAAAWGVGNETIVLAGELPHGLIMEAPFRRHSSKSYRIHLRRQVSSPLRSFFGAFEKAVTLTEPALNPIEA